MNADLWHDFPKENCKNIAVKDKADDFEGSETVEEDPVTKKKETFCEAFSFGVK